MGKLANFTINLDSAQAVYYPYQTISGTITLELKKPMEIEAIGIKLDGKGYCEWIEEICHQTDINDCCETIVHSGKETILKYEEILLKKASTIGKRFFHSAGRHAYAFSFPLPGHLPSTFESDIGHIRYRLKAKIERPWKTDVKLKYPIVINDVIDPNLNKYATDTRGGEKHEVIGCYCMCSAAGPIEFSANIDRSCFCPGEPVFINMLVKNHTKKEIKSTYVHLIQTVTYSMSPKSKILTKKVAELKGPSIGKYADVSWNNQPFGIPALPPTIENSTVISVQYTLVVGLAVPRGIHPEIRMTITIGTVPFVGVYGLDIDYGTSEDPHQRPEANYEEIPDHPLVEPSVFGYSDMVPPLYSAAIGQGQIYVGNNRDDRTYGSLQYIPLYTFAQPCNGMCKMHKKSKPCEK